MGDPALCQTTTAVYHPRKLTDSPLYRLLLDHFDHFEQVYDEWFNRINGFYRPIISEIIRSYLKCGDLKQGFARVRCPDCHYEYLLAFSCRGRWFCQGCTLLYIRNPSHTSVIAFCLKTVAAQRFQANTYKILYLLLAVL